MCKSFKELLEAKREVKRLTEQLGECQTKNDELEEQLEGCQTKTAELEAELNPEIPSFQKWRVQRSYFVQKLQDLGIEPIELDDNLVLNGWYSYTTLESWGEILEDLVFSSNLARLDEFDCDAYAFKAQTECAERYRVNGLRMCIGKFTRDGIVTAHSFNLFPYGNEAGIEGIMLFEPNAGYDWSGILELGDFDYQPSLVLV